MYLIETKKLELFAIIYLFQFDNMYNEHCCTKHLFWVFIRILPFAFSRVNIGYFRLNGIFNKILGLI